MSAKSWVFVLLSHAILEKGASNPRYTYTTAVNVQGGFIFESMNILDVQMTCN